MNEISVWLGKIQSLFEGRQRGTSILLLALFFANALIAALLHSGAGDEMAAHIPCGYLYWKSGIFSGGIDNFPLGQILVTLPVGLFRIPYTLYTEEHLFLFRVMPLLMGLGLCALVWRFATKLFGRGAGTLALFFAALCPNILAHSTLATLDLPVAFFVFLVVFLLDSYVETPTTRRMLLLSSALGAAVLIKVQALLLVPFVILVLLLYLPRTSTNGRQARRSVLLSWLILPATGFLLVSLAYLHPPGRGGALLPPLFLDALRGLVAHSEEGHVAYLMGSYSKQGWWYFFPLIVAVKTPLAELLLAVAGLARRQPRRVLLFVTLPIIMFLGAAMTSRINIGLRHVLMIYPFLAVAAGAGAVRLWEAGSRRGSRVASRSIDAGSAAVILLLLLTVAEVIAIAPHHLSYFNIIADGPKNGHRISIDSNYDWGVNDRFLRRYAESRGLSYKIDPPAFRPVNGHILVNANALYGLLNLGPKAYDWLRVREPVNRIAYTWFEYDIPQGTFREEREDVEARAGVLAHMFRRSDEAASVPGPEYMTILARGFAEFGAYDVAFDELRAVLDRSPAFPPAIGLGGAIMIRKKLGILFFRGDEYLTGVHTPRPARATPDDPETTIALARRGGMAGNLSRVESDLGGVLLKSGDRGRARASFDLALRLDPSNGAAREALSRLGVGR